ncbi:MAG: RAD55 family ATPase, partial [Methanosarcinales archaeon]
TSEESEYIRKEMYTSFGWDFWELEKSGIITFVDITDPNLRLQKSIDIAPTELIKSFRNLLKNKITKENPKRVFIDSIEALFLAIDSSYKMRSLVDDLFGVLRKLDVTTVVTVSTGFEVDHIIEYGADSVIRLGRVISGNNLQRSICVLKLRGSNTVNEVRVLNISNTGMIVLPMSPFIK